MAGIIIVGAGECGARSAFALRKKGYDGKVTLVGEERHMPYERPPLSKKHPVTMKAIYSEEDFVEADIALIRGRRVKTIDTVGMSVGLDDGASLPYTKLLITTGARPRLFPGMEAARTLRTSDDAEAILTQIGTGTKISIIGGGFIGLELAATARSMGASVTVIETADRLMARAVPAAIAAVVEARHRSEDVNIILGAHVASAGKDHVLLTDGRRIEADLVVAGVGAVPNTELAEKAGLSVANGIVVDGHFCTSTPHIYAAGDCCAFPYEGQHVRLESWRATIDHANHVAISMLDENDHYAKIPWFWSDQYDLMLQVCGLLTKEGTFHRRDIDEDTFVLFQTAIDGRIVAAAGIGKGNTVAKDIRLAEMMIERRIEPDPTKLIDPSINLKTLLKG